MEKLIQYMKNILYSKNIKYNKPMKYKLNFHWFFFVKQIILKLKEKGSWPRA